MNKHLTAVSANGKQVYAYLTQDPLAASVARNPHLLTLIREAVTLLEITGAEVIIEQDMGHTIGYSELLETREKDIIFYARTSKLPEYTRFVRQRKAEQTSVLTFKLLEDDENTYELVAAWIGKDYPPMPNGTAATPLSKEYWANHAVIFNGQTILTSTITKECPY